MNLRKISIILLLAAIAILSFTAYYKLQTKKKVPAGSITPPVTIPTQNNAKFTGPTGMPSVKGPTAPPY
jgi:lipopolysaccharide export system protein LptC